MTKPVYHFSSHDIESALSIINTAIKNHRRWFDNLHTSIVCKQPFAEDILHEAAHTQCDFGKWYYGDVSDSIKSLREFGDLEAVHTYMHSHARDLALLSQNQKQIEVEDYQAFLNNQRQLIDLLTRLRDTLIEQEHCFDGLTGAVNRRTISIFLEQTFENCKRYKQHYSIAMLDVDHFKKVNDTYGHITGDYVLKHICLSIRDHLRKSDCIGRYGGEEFLIIFPETKKADVTRLMDKIRSRIADQEISINSSSVKVSVSAGVSDINSNDDNAWQAVDRADKALYKAKNTGRNLVIAS